MVEVAPSIGAGAARPSRPDAPARARARAQWGPIVAVGGAAIGAALLVWWATGPWGAGLSPDAIAYSAIAERIRDHRAMGYWLEPQSSSWPPLFPLVLAGLSALTSASVIDTGRWLNGLLQGATVVVVAALAWRLLRSTWLRALAVVVAVLAQPLVYVATKVWSEPLFNLFVLSAALVLSGVPGTRPRLRVVGASALVVGAFMTRYAGLAFLPAGVLVVALWPRMSTRPERMRRALWFAGPGAIAAVALVWWNRARTGNAFGPRWRPDEPFWNHGADGLGAIGQWFLPTDTARAVTIGMGLLVFAIVTLVLVWAWRDRPTAPENERAVIGVAPVLAVFIVCYFGYMVWARTSSGFDPLNSRLMLPILVPGVLLLLNGAERWAQRLEPGLSRQLALAVPLLLLLPVVFRGVDALRLSHDSGNEYTSAPVRQFVASPVLRDVPDDCALVSNDPWLLWLADFEAQLAPESDREVAIPQSMTLDEFAALASAQSVCLVWLETGSTVFYTPDELAEVVQLQPIASDDFTTIYRVSAPA